MILAVDEEVKCRGAEMVWRSSDSSEKALANEPGANSQGEKVSRSSTSKFIQALTLYLAKCPKKCITHNRA